MAEGFVNYLLSDKFEAYSAGLKPSEVNPYAIQVMSEIGIDISQQRSKHVNELIDKPFDLVITVCDNAKENCPVLPGAKNITHIPFRDPATATGSEEEILQIFREVRDEIRKKIPRLLKKEFPT